MIRVGDTVRCNDNSAREDWARWYGDDAYSEDMLECGKLYLVRAIATGGGQTGFDIGIPTPWGDQFWNADRFEKSLLHLPERCTAIADTHPKDGDVKQAPLVSGGGSEGNRPKDTA